jgi:ketosteroid isomerase-like protein
METTELAGRLAGIERDRLRSLVEVRVADADAVHADGFVLVTPSGHCWSKAQYLGDIASGRVNYRRFEAVSDIEVMVDGNLAVLRYRSAIDIAVEGQEPGELECWHLDCYRRGDDGSWRVHWSQATSISDS